MLDLKVQMKRQSADDSSKRQFEELQRTIQQLQKEHGDEKDRVKQLED